jgi:4-amino-4-deoxy-L-arabinose transferase-like glycosyltransferase
MRRAVRRIPPPLALLLVVVALFGVAWAMVTPAFQSPDETEHFSYVQTVAELGRLPGGKGKGKSTEQLIAETATNAQPAVFSTYAQPESSRSAFEGWLRSDQGRRDDGGGFSGASSYPPAYYLFETVPYLVAKSGTIFDRLYLMRIFSIFWLLVSTTAAWLLAGEVFGRAPRRQLLTAATVGLWPMLTFMSSTLNPDSMLYATWGVALWLGARLIRRGLTIGRAIALAAAIGLALVTKATSVALIPAGMLAVVIAVVRAPREVRRRQIRALAVVGAACLVPLAAWYFGVRESSRPAYTQLELLTSGPNQSLKGFLSYLWAFYLPRVPGQEVREFAVPVLSSYPAYTVWIGTGWAAFGWVTNFLPKPSYIAFTAITVTLIVATAVPGVRALAAEPRVTLRRVWPWGAFFAAAFVPLWLGVHWSEYKIQYVFIQGRYLFPLAGVFALVVAKATMVVPPPLRGRASGAILGALVVFQVACLLLVSAAYYA